MSVSIWAPLNGFRGSIKKNVDAKQKVIDKTDGDFAKVIDALAIADTRKSRLDLRYLNFHDEDFSDTCYEGPYDLRHSNISHARLVSKPLTGSLFHRSFAESTDFSGAVLKNADFSLAKLACAKFGAAVLRDADFTAADLRDAEFEGADLSGATGLPSSTLHGVDFTPDGMVVYKRITPKGAECLATSYHMPKSWNVCKGSYLEENCCASRTHRCGCGVNFGTLEWCLGHYASADLWECLIETRDVLGVVIPYGTTGKGRCERLKLVRRISKAEQERLKQTHGPAWGD